MKIMGKEEKILHNEKLHNLYSSANTVMIIFLRGGDLWDT